MGIIAWIILGALAGWIASLIMRTDAEQGAVANVIIGILGALLGGFLMQAFGASGVNGFSFYSLLVAVGGAVLLIAVVRAFRGRSHRV
ncbi:GlsB/YeaQ/YmgE family stress response membrane protein [Candidatus Saccharibacteria bacterium]|nr:GlsB/YeaQ/YmgE family stress response membrane protein [Candidatus Saccharibacteria bacterium]